VAELAEPVLIQSNPLYNDQMLFGMYMRALDALLADSELRAAMDEFRLSPNTLRGKMIRGARRVLQTAPREFTVYEAAQARLSGTPEPEAQARVFRFAGTVRYILRMAFDPKARAQGFRFADDFGSMLRMAFLGVGLVGALFAVAGVASIPAWPWTEPLVWAGASMIAAAGLLSGVHWLLGTRLGLTLLRGELILGINPELDEARNRLMAAISQDELLAQARTVINTTRQDRFGHAYSVAGTSGLSETFDSTFQVPTGTAAELDGLLARLDGASIGVAGPRGSGKSTLIRGYCDEPVQGNPQESSWRGLRAGEVAVADLRCAVAAPVDYAARDFVLHLFAVFCAFLLLREPPTRQPPALGAICAAVVREELRRKTRAVAHVASSTAPGQAQDLQHALYDIVRQLAPGAPALKIVDIACQPGQGESAAVTSLRLDFAAYAYYCATLQDVFTDHLDAEHMIKATSASPEPGSFDALAAARHAFTLDTLLAWRSITQFRKAWFLETRDPVNSDGTITTPTNVT
jgi:hypothetical protein